MAKDEELQQEVDEFFSRRLDPMRTMLERIWYRNILYVTGEQWIDWSITGETFRSRIRTSQAVPTPVSNICRDYVRSTAALILNKDFRMSVWPNTDEQSDRDAAKVADDLIRSMDLSNDEEFFDEIEKVANWMIIAGTAFMRVFPSMDRGAFGVAADGSLIKSGEVVRENLIPFNVIVDPIGDKLRAKTRIGIKSLKPKEWVEDSFKVILADDSNSQEIDYQRRLMTYVANVSPWKGSGLESQVITTPSQDLVLFKEIEFQPTKEFKNGRYVVSAGGQIVLNAKRMPVKASKEGWDYSLTEFQYNYVPGRFWADPGLNDQISPQNTINEIDQALAMNRKSLGRPTVITPGDVTLKRVNKGGQSYLHISYDALEAAGAQPVIHSGTALPQQVLAERAINVGVSKDAAGNPKNVLSGEAPSARASGVLVDELQEAAEESHVPDIRRFYRSQQRVQRKSLIVASELYTEERLIKVEGKGTLPKIRSFKASDLRNNTDVRINVASGIASTDAGKVSMVMRLLESGGFLFSDLGKEPELQGQLLSRLGLDEFKDTKSVDIQRADEENARLASGDILGVMMALPPDPTRPDQPASDAGGGEVMIDDPLFKHDNHAIHYAVHRKFILGDEFKSLDEKTRTVALAHADNHETIMKQQAEAAQKAAIEAEQAKRTPRQATT